MDGSLERYAKGGGHIVLAAGGTGGHLFPAQALAEMLVARGYVAHLFTDARGLEWKDRFPAREVHHIASATLTPSRPWKLPLQAWRLAAGYRLSSHLLDALRPRVVVGFGGYPSLPPLIAARRLGITTMIHEQNAVLGRANRVLAGHASVIAASFEPLHGLKASLADKVRLTGNPVRRVVIDHARTPYQKPAGDAPFHLLVFGGSQGARFFSELMPKVVAELPQAVTRRLRLTQQCRPEDMAEVETAYRGLGLAAELRSFFDDLPARIADSHLVICRSGASTVAELGVLGRPAIYVPLPHALDNDQLRNAESMSRAGGGWIMRQGAFTPAEMAAILTRLRYHDSELPAAAEAAQRHGRPDAAGRLADIVERLARPALASSKDAR